jgi:MGT family glycosyltransferase
MTKSKKLNCIFFGIPSQGHTNPTLKLVKQMIKLQHKVTYYNTAPFKDLIQMTGAEFKAYNSKTLNNIAIPISTLEPHEVTIELQKIFILSSVEILDEILGSDIEEQVDVVCYDQMAIWGYIYAKVKNLISFSSNSMFLFTSDEILSQMPKLRYFICEDYMRKLNILKRYLSEINSYMDILDIQTSSKAENIIIYSSLEFQPKNYRFKGKNNYFFLGNRYDSGYSVNNNPLISKSLVYISLGTVFNEKMNLFLLLLLAFSSTHYRIIVSTGKNEDIYNKLKEFNKASNIEIHLFIDQIEVLSKASLFITHAGFNSIYEGAYFTVPMLMIPHNPEQYINAKRVQALNGGLILEKKDLTLDGIHNAICRIENNWQENKLALRKIRENFLNSYNNKTAIKWIENVVNSKK